MASISSISHGLLCSTLTVACLLSCDDTATPGVEQPDAAAVDAGTSATSSAPAASTQPSATGGASATAPRPTHSTVASGTPATPDAAPPSSAPDASPEGDAAAPDAGTANDAGLSDADAGSPGDFSGIEAVPLLDRPVTGSYDCSVTTPATLLNIPSGFDGSLTSQGAAVWYVRGETPNTGSPSLVLSQLDRAGMLSGSVTLNANSEDSYSSSRIVATPNGLLVFSLRYGNGGGELMLASTTLSGEVTQLAAPLAGLDGGADTYVLAVGEQDIGLLWSRYTGDGYALYYVTLDLAGVVQGSPQLVRSGEQNLVPGAITATPEGYLFSYIVGYQPAELFVQTADAAATLGAAVPTVSRAEGLSAGQSMLRRGTDVLLAWTDTGGTWDNSDLDRTTILTRVDLDGQRVAKDVRVQSPVTNQECVTPKLLPRGADVGVLWSEGSVIYICAGCMPDNHLRFALLDGATLAPSGDALTLTNPATMGGLVNPSAAWQGDDLSVAAAVGYHTSGEGAAGTITCSAQ